MTNRKKALALTVGTGNIDDLERTLLTPMIRSIEEGKWGRIVLLPSRTTEKFAQTLSERITEPAVEIRALPEAGQENDADACFGHFDSVLADLIDEGFAKNDVRVDFTRGTKAMSAALVLAAVGRDVPILRYVHGEQRDERGMVVPGTEQIGEIRTNLATARGRLDQAGAFMRHGDFSAAIELLPALSGPFANVLFPEQLHGEASALRAAAQIYAAWDRLDYRAAADKIALGESEAAGAGEFALTPEMSDWIHRLKRVPDAPAKEKMAAYLRVLACDLLANAERRLRDRHFEDAQLRVYRVLELLGQIRLFDRGYDSAALPPDDENVRAFREKPAKHVFGVNAWGTLTAPRELAARFLEHLGDPLAQRLLAFGRSRAFQAGNRNRSILIHGFDATASADEGAFDKVLNHLTSILTADDPEAPDRLKVAGSLSFSGG